MFYITSSIMALLSSHFNFHDVASTMQDFEKDLPKSYCLENTDLPLFSPSVSTPERKKKKSYSVRGLDKSPFILSPKFSPAFIPKTPERGTTDSPPVFTPVNKGVNKWQGSPLAYRLMSVSPRMFLSRLNKENISPLPLRQGGGPSMFSKVEPATPKLSLAGAFGSPSSMLPSSPTPMIRGDTMPRLSLPPNFSGMGPTNKLFTPNLLRSNQTVVTSSLFKRPTIFKNPMQQNTKPLCDLCKERQTQGEDRLTLLRAYWKLPCSEKAYFHLPCW